MGSTWKQKKEDAAVYRQWTPEQKFSIIMEHHNDRVPVSNLCRKHTLSPQLFSRWRDEFIENGKNIFVKQENPDSLLLREINDYKRLVAELILANEELQKIRLLKRGERR